MSLLSKEFENTNEQFFVGYLSLLHKKKNRKKIQCIIKVFNFHFDVKKNLHQKYVFNVQIL